MSPTKKQAARPAKKVVKKSAAKKAKRPARTAPAPVRPTYKPDPWPPLWLKTAFAATFLVAWAFTLIGRYTLKNFNPPPGMDVTFLGAFTYMIGTEAVKRARNGNGNGNH